MDNITKRKQFEMLNAQLDSERSSFIPHWRDLSDHILTRRARFNTADVNKGDRRNQKIIDSTATLAARTLRSGMMAGITSPARPWFRITTPDPDLAEFGSVKNWLDLVQRRMQTAYLRSNLYNILPVMYGDLGTFGTSPMSIEESFDGDIIHTKSFPVGSYKIAKDEQGKVNTFVRDFKMTVAQLVEKFARRVNGKIDWSNFSQYVKDQYDQGMYQTWIDVCHVIMPNKDHNPDRPHSKFKKFLSYYYETGSSTGDAGKAGLGDTYLRESGYDYFPVLCPRWETTGEDVYGTACPGMDALGDIKQLQHGEKRVMEAIDKTIRPPMTGPTSMKNQVASLLPGDITYVDQVNGGGFRPVHEVKFPIQEMEMKQAQIRTRIQKAFFEDLFLMLANSDRRQITAREIEERHEEKLLALGPVLEQLNQDLLDPMTDIVFDILMRQGQIPPPPPEIEGMALKVEYISIMAQAQKMVGIAGVERFAGFVGQMATADPRVLDKIDGDQMIDVYGDMTSVPPSLIRTDDQVAAIRGDRQKAQDQQNQLNQIEQGAAAARDLGAANVGEDAALGQLLANSGMG